MSRKLARAGIYFSVPLTLATTALVADETKTTKKAANPEYSANVEAMGKGTAPLSRKLVRTYATSEKIHWKPLFHQYDSMKLSIAGPGIEPFETNFEKGEQISFGIYDEQSTIWSDGVYKWELTATPTVSGDTKEFMRTDRNETTVADVGSYLRATGLLPAGQDMKQSGTFSIVDGQLIRLKGERELRRDQKRMERVEAAGFAGDQDPVDGAELRAQVFTTDLVVQGSTCTGFDCVNGESFGFDTLRLKENNLRIHFQDTSTSASFPSNDWRIVANDTSNGGANYLGIEDATAGRIPFRVEAGAPVNALYVEADGDVGIKTANPVVDLHVVEGNTPTLRLEQDGSDGFTPQTWDLAGNESNFFIRDVTNGSKLSFRIEPSTPQDTLYLEDTGDVGVGTNAPTEALHVRRTDDSAQIKIEDVGTANTTTPQTMLLLENAGPAQLQFADVTNGSTWNISTATDNSLQIDNPGETGVQLLIEEDGTVTATGTVMGSSDRNVKKNITNVSPAEILEKVASLPVHEWTYINDKQNARHVGPMAQDFMKAFGLGKNDKHIAFSDTSGVALAAIQGLHEVVAQKDAQLEELRSKTEELEAQLKMLIEKVGAGDSTD